VLGLPVVELEHEYSVREEPFVVWAAVVALQAEELLIPQAGCLDVAHSDQCLGLCGANRDDHTDAVAGGIIDLCEPAFAVVELRRSVYGAAVGGDSLERRCELVGADPYDRSTFTGRGSLGCPLADHSVMCDLTNPGSTQQLQRLLRLGRLLLSCSIR
jgi:hypothetical protein